jgi:hypothetical protein
MTTANTSVVQPWVAELPWKMQSILFSGLRGPDQEFLQHTKQVSKWMRAVSQHNADPSKPYMNNIHLPTHPDDQQVFYKELEHCPCHFVHHFLDALAVIAYGHPEPKVSLLAAEIHYDVAEELFHFVPEMPEIFCLRHRDKKQGEDPLDYEWSRHTGKVKAHFMLAVGKRWEKA